MSYLRLNVKLTQLLLSMIYKIVVATSMPTTADSQLIIKRLHLLLELMHIRVNSEPVKANERSKTVAVIVPIVVVVLVVIVIFACRAYKRCASPYL